jgi:opacity protein-like surface antigen
MNRSLVLAAVLAAACIPPAMAHHSAVQFDFTKTVPYKGVVKEFAAINPHMRLLISVKDAKGTHDIKFEGHSTNNMYRAGYRKGMVKVGDTVTVNAAPLRDGTEGGYVVSVELADGEFFGQRSTRAQDAAATAAAEKTKAEAH